MSRSIFSFSICLFILVSMATSFSPVTAHAAQKIENSINQPSVDIDRLQQAIKQSADLNDAEKSQLSLQLDQAKSWRQKANQAIEELNQVQQHAFNTEQRASSLEAKLSELNKQVQKVQNYDTNQYSVTELTQNLSNAQSQLSEANESFLKWDSTLSQYQKLATNGIQKKLELENAIEKLNADNDQGSISANSDLPNQVAALSIKLRLQQQTNRLALVNFKLTQLENLTQNAQQERDYWNQVVTFEQQIVNHWQALLQSKKSMQAKNELAEITKQKISLENPLYPLYQQALNLQKQKNALLSNEEDTRARIAQVKNLFNQMKVDFTRDQQIIELQGSKEIVAQILHKRFESITNSEIKEKRITEVREQLNQAVLEQLLVSEQIRNNQQKENNQLENILQQMDEQQKQQWQAMAEQLYLQLLNSLKDLQSTYPSYVSKLAELDSLYQKQKEQFTNYQTFLKNNLLWLPNANIDTLFSWQVIGSNLGSLFSSTNLIAFYNDFKNAVSQQIGAVILWLMLIATLIAGRKKLIEQLKETSKPLYSIKSDSMRYTIKALTLTFTIALISPLFLLGLHSLLNSIEATSAMGQSIQPSLLNAAILVLILGSLKHICRPDGLAERHFKWNPIVTYSLYRELRWAIPLTTIVVVLIGLNTDIVKPANEQILGRFGFILLMIVFAILIYRLWGPNRPLIKQAKKQVVQKSVEKASWLQLHLVWYSLLMLIPILLIFSTIYGYYYSSILIAERINLTLGLFLVAYISRELLLRYIYLSERKQHYQDRIKHINEVMKNAEKNEEKKTDQLPENDEPEINYEKLGQQIKQTINLSYFLAFAFGAWFLWSDVLIALNLIGDSNLPLSKSALIDGVNQQVPLTLSDLLQGLGLGIITLLVAKNLPGILEYTVLKFLPISSATRYATSSLTQYLFAIIGLVVIFRALGIEWSNIQWLVAALSVGLGFGLQEIVANFISGIILLFEQPIRVGDIVTVNNTSGKVSKIRIRATTIVNWDRQELLIPNKDIITGELINWSLSDPINRLQVTVGVAYGSDIKKAMQLMQDAAEEHPSILNEPESSVIFNNFGDNSLEIILRGFVSEIENKLVVKSELNSIINEKFAEAGIEISFPQRDVHLDTSTPLEIKLMQTPKKSQE